MLIALQALAFAGCVLLDLLPGTEVQCRFDVPVVGWSTPPPPPAAEPADPAVAPPPGDPPADQREPPHA